MNTTSIETILDLTNKTAIVTGGAMGIGLGIVKRLSETGANIVIADLDEKVGNESVQELKSLGRNVSFIKTDVSKKEDIQNAIDFTITTYGGVDILVNNAGIYPQIPMMKIDTETVDKILAINLTAVFLFTRSVAEVMIKQGKGGKIINITSIDAIHPSSVGLAVYDASKHGVWGFTKNIALELAPHGIQVNAIAPGGISTPGTGMDKSMTPEREEIVKKFIQKIPMKRIGEADDIGKVALFLASDLSSYMTGSQIVVDGGVLLA